MGVLSESDALRVADDFAAAARSGAARDVVAVILIGSLAIGAYVPGRSDIDTAVILTNTSGDDVVQELERLASAYVTRYGIPKGLGIVPIRIDQLYRRPEPSEELAPELLDIHERGRLLAGALDLSKVWLPGEDDLRAYCKVFIPWLRDERRDPTRPAANRTVDAEINGLLYEYRLTVLSRRGRYLLPKRDVIPALLDDPMVENERGLAQIMSYLERNGDPPSLETVQRLRDEAEVFNERHAARWISD